MKLDKCETLPKSGIVMLSYTIPRRMKLARWLSIVFHPFVMVGVMVGAAAAARQTRGEAVRSVGDRGAVHRRSPGGADVAPGAARQMGERRRVESRRASHSVYRRRRRDRRAARVPSAASSAVVHGPWRSCDARHDGRVRPSPRDGSKCRCTWRLRRWRRTALASSRDRRSATRCCWRCRRSHGRGSPCSGTRRSKWRSARSSAPAQERRSTICDCQARAAFAPASAGGRSRSFLRPSSEAARCTIRGSQAPGTPEAFRDYLSRQQDPRGAAFFVWLERAARSGRRRQPQ